MKSFRSLPYGSVLCLGLTAGLLSACGSTDEINLIAGDSKMSFAQAEDGSYVRTDAGALGDLSEVLPEGIVPVGNVVSAQGTVPTEVAAAGSATDASASRGFNFGNFTFRTARAAEREAARQEEEAASGQAGAAGSTAAAAGGDADSPGLLMRLLGMGGGGAAATASRAPELGSDGLPVVTFDQSRTSNGRVNKYLWNATAQTLSFMPLAVADQSRGLFVTDWYMDSERRPERVRVDVQHTDAALGPGSFHVTVYRQVLENGVWRGAPSSLPAARELEQRILLAAQKLKIAEA